MSEENLNQSPEEIDDSMNANDLMANIVQDLVLDNDPKDVANEFIDEFVLRDRPETPQILAMLEMPTDNLVEMMKDMLEQGYQTQLQAVDNHGLRYFENLKAAVRAQMIELSEQ